jgi:hypothetical protein
VGFLIQIAYEVGVEAYSALLENSLLAIQETQDEEAIAKLRRYLFDE